MKTETTKKTEAPNEEGLNAISANEKSDSDQHLNTTHLESEDSLSTIRSPGTEADVDGDNEVAIVGYGEYDGHLSVGIDMNGDGQIDSVIIDVDDSGDFSDSDILITDDDKITSFDDIEAAEAEYDDTDDFDSDSSVDAIDDTFIIT